MPNLTCSDCGTLNAIPADPAGGGFVCASCDAALPVVPPIGVAPMLVQDEPPLFVGQYTKGDEWSVQGPFPVVKIRRWIVQGRVTREMYFALDQDSEDSWMGGHEFDLFPPPLEEVPVEVEALPSVRRERLRRGERGRREVHAEGSRARCSLASLIVAFLLGGGATAGIFLGAGAGALGDSQSRVSEAPSLGTMDWRELADHIDRELIPGQRPIIAGTWSIVYGMLTDGSNAWWSNGYYNLKKMEKGTGKLREALEVLQQKLEQKMREAGR